MIRLLVLAANGIGPEIAAALSSPAIRMPDPDPGPCAAHLAHLVTETAL